MLRLFVAFDVPEAQKDSVEEAIAALAVPGARWTSRQSWHVTLKFLGATPEERLSEVTGVVEQAASASQPARTSLGGIGAFPRFRRARVLWVGLDDAGGVLGALARTLEEGFVPLGFAAEGRPWTPHLTLARFKVPAPVALEPDRIRLDERPFEVGEIVLFRSHLKAGGAVYEPLARFQLGRSI
ncbi:MAG: 2,3-cyclic 3-phosphodiesterase [Actinomycetota bacterium]|jgi:2'-5' RNA ligase|nr:2,3-cyclic 3-phosphodiesterase [Actinomycetota bacterium]MEA2592147.1 2,3-cyclic 3-phosphodiesterase [Actinomycetota bacterium]